MIKINEAVIVEGRYDQIKLDSVVDGLVITTEGFNIFKDDEKAALIKRLSETVGIVVLTDSDEAGFKIRKYIQDIAAKGRVYHAYIPDIAGKEKRKPHAGKEGLLGVEGVDGALIENAILRAIKPSCQDEAKNISKREITILDLYEDGISGAEGSEAKRRRLKTLAGVPKRLSTKAFLTVLNTLFTLDEYKTMIQTIEKEEKTTNEKEAQAD